MCIKNKVILVTGANGYIGKHVVDALISQGVEVVAVDLVTDQVNRKARIINTDIFDEVVDIYQRLGAPDVCLHLAWREGFIHNSFAHLEDLPKHYKFIKSMIEAGVKHVAVMGTMHEIGYFEGAVDEHTPCNPISLYGIVKDAFRRSLFLLARNQGITLQWLRAFYIYGDDQRNHSIFTKILQAVDNGQETFPFTTGRHLCDFIHVDELANMITTCVLQNEIQGIINCCTGRPISLAEKVEGFIKDNNLKIYLNYGAFPDRPYDSPGIWGDNTKIQQILSSKIINEINKVSK